MTRLLKPLLHNLGVTLMPGAVTPPPSMSSHSCSPAPSLLTHHAPVGGPNRPPAAEPSSPQLSVTASQGDFDPLQRSPVACHRPPVPHQTSTVPPASHCSAPPSLSSSPHEHTSVPRPVSSSSIPSALGHLLVDLSGPGGEIPQSYPHFFSQPQLQPSVMAAQPLLNLQEMEWGDHSAQLSYIDEGRPPV